MAVAVMQGRKTVTRRIINPQPEGGGIIRHLAGEFFARQLSEDNRWCDIRSAYRPGERVAMLATWAVSKGFDHLKPREITLEEATHPFADFWHSGMGEPKSEYLGKSRPGRFLPDHLRGLMPILEIVSVHAERLQHIRDADAIREGLQEENFTGWGDEPHLPHVPEPTVYRGFSDAEWEESPIEAFRVLWNSINAKPEPVLGEDGKPAHYVSYPFDGVAEIRINRGKPCYVCPNPWVFRYEFRRITA
ncbi:hypothetical protein OPIT5_03980 [Opitutaceae bacterium TAV5]|nr:hypothetical protein OPIT5_03980 [Opitutaceae bacterium TAV5]